MRRTLVSALIAATLAPVFAFPTRAQWSPLNPVKSFQNGSDGVEFKMESGTLKLLICSDSIVRVLYSPTDTFPNRPDYIITKKDWPATPWHFDSTEKDITITTAKLKVTVTRADGTIQFSDASGKHLMFDGGRKMSPTEVNNEKTYRAETFVSVYGSPEAFYGLGQHQAGVWNYRGESVDISQDNTNIAVPFLVSSNGYGLFWNNASRSRFNNRFMHYLYISSEVADVIDYYFIYGP